MPNPYFAIAMEGDLLVSRAVGPTGRERRVEIPVAAIEGFCVDPTGEAANAMIPWDAYLVVVWHDGAERKREKAPVLKDSAVLAKVLDELKRLRPDASLLDIPPRAAMKKLGLRSARTDRLWVTVIVLALLAAAGLFGLLHSRHSDNNRTPPAQPSPPSAPR